MREREPHGKVMELKDSFAFTRALPVVIPKKQEVVVTGFGEWNGMAFSPPILWGLLDAG